MATGETTAYLLVDNVADDTIVEFPGATRKGSLWSGTVLGRDVRAISMDLVVHRSASNAKKLRTVGIDFEGLS